MYTAVELSINNSDITDSTYDNKENWRLKCPICKLWIVLYVECQYRHGAVCDYYCTNFKLGVKIKTKQRCKFNKDMRPKSWLFSCCNPVSECHFDLCLDHAKDIHSQQQQRLIQNIKCIPSIIRISYYAQLEVAILNNNKWYKCDKISFVEQMKIWLLNFINNVRQNEKCMDIDCNVCEQFIDNYLVPYYGYLIETETEIVLINQDNPVFSITRNVWHKSIIFYII